MPNCRNDGDMSWLTAVTSEADAGILQELLSTAEIPFYTVRRGAGGYLRIVMGSSVFGQDIYVRKEDYEKALALLDDCYAAADVSDEELTWQAEHTEDGEEPGESGSYQTFFWILGAMALLLALLWILS